MIPWYSIYKDVNMKKIAYYTTLFFILISAIKTVDAQNKQDIDSLQNLINNTSEDTTKVYLLLDLCREYLYNDAKKGMSIANEALVISKENNFQMGLILCYKNMGMFHGVLGEYSTSIEYFEKSLEVCKLKKDTTETTKILNNIGVVYLYQGNYEKAIKNFEYALEIFKETNNQEGIAICYTNIGHASLDLGNITKAYTCFMESLKVDLEISNKEGIAISYSNIGDMHEFWGNYSDAISYQLKSLKISKEINDQREIAECLTSIGNIYQKQNNHLKAIEYFEEALGKVEIIGNKKRTSELLNAIGISNIEQQKYSEAIDNLYNALAISNEIGDKSEIGESYKLIGILKRGTQKYEQSLENLHIALEVYLELKKEIDIASTYIEIGETYYRMQNFNDAIKYCIKGLEIAQEIGLKDYTLQVSGLLANIYAEKQDFKKAFYYHKIFKEVNDSIFTLESSNKIQSMESMFEIENKEKEIQIQKMQLSKQQVEIKQHRTLKYTLIGGIVAVLLIVLLVSINFVKERKAKTKIHEQKVSIEEANKELEITHAKITASINYASRIQSAVLPSHEKLNKILPNHFILFKPRDVVSGDFFWVKEINDFIIVAAADCTGHGVPGAFMSMLGISFLNEIVLKNKTTKASEILEELRKQVKQTLGQTGKSKEAKDGLDIALAVIDKKNKRLQFSGANSPLYVIRNKELPAVLDLKPTTSSKIDQNKVISEEQILIRIKADSQPIGVYLKERPFTNTEIQLLANDHLYLFSDGYVDQIGGERSAKFMTKRFKQLLMEVSMKAVEEQSNILNNTIELWKNGNDQVDDILIIGIKV